MKFLRQSIESALLVALLLLSGCVPYEGVFVEASRPGVAISQSEASVAKEVSDQVASELNLERASEGELAAYNAYIRQFGTKTETLAMYYFPGNGHQLAILVSKRPGSPLDPGALVVQPASLRVKERTLRRIAELFNRSVGPGRAKFEVRSNLGW